jgi:hypothetical protein
LRDIACVLLLFFVVDPITLIRDMIAKNDINLLMNTLMTDWFFWYLSLSEKLFQ